VKTEREHERPRRRASRRDADAPAPAHSLLALQRSAGNAAVARVLQRFGTGEHGQMGGARTVTLHGEQVTESELLAMGDLYASAADMEADAKGFPGILALVRRDVNFRKGVPGVTKVKDNEWEAATAHMPAGKHYSELAQDNDTHFAPYAVDPDATSAPDSGDHRSEWLKYHIAALEKTAEHVRGGGKGVPPEAITLNGFGGHFLTDAFSAGHIMAKQQIKDYAMKKADELGADETWLDIIPESSFSVGVAERILAHPVAGKKLRQYKVRIIEWGDMEVTKLSEVIYRIQEKEPGTFFGAFAVIVHDKLNDSIEKGSPFGPLEVMNDRGTKWNLPGDGNLGLSPQTLTIARAAVEQAYQNLADVAMDPAKAARTGDMYRKVWEYVPWPTANGYRMIDQVLAAYADPAKPEAQDEVAKFIIAEIDIVIAKLIARDRLATPEEVDRRFRAGVATLVAPPMGF
jgi:hypothetical protein